MSDTKEKIDLKPYEEWGTEELGYAVLGAYAALALAGTLASKGIEDGAVLQISDGKAEPLSGEEAKNVKGALNMIMATNREMLRRFAERKLADSTTLFDDKHGVADRTEGFGEALFRIVIDELMPEVMDGLEESGVPIRDILEKTREKKKDGNQWKKWTH